MINNVLGYLKILFLLSVSGASYAGSQIGQVAEIRVSSQAIPNGNPTHFRLIGSAQNQPACSAQPFWAINTDTPGGKSFLATLMIANLTRQPIAVSGTNTCDLRSDMESAVQMQIVQ